MDSTENPSEKDVRDLLYTTAKALIASIPVLGGGAAEYFGWLIASPMEKRRDQWFTNLAYGLAQLEERFQDFETRKVFTNDQFISVFLEASRYAIVNHNQENLRALRNAVLNAAISISPDEIQQKMFIVWAGEMTAWYIRLLRLFKEHYSEVPDWDLESSSWQMNITRDQFADLVERQYPDMVGGYHTYIQIVGDLYRRNLLTHSIPGRNTLSSVSNSPILSLTAEAFLNFIASPIEASNEVESDG